MAINNTVENINNQPTIQPRTVTGIFTKYIAKTLPLAFDESMSYYECLCALLEYINEDIVPDINNVNDGLEELQQFYLQLQEYVNTYFDNLDVQEEINNKLDKMAEDGTLTNLIKAYVDPIYEAYETEINNRVNNQNTEITNFKNLVGDEIAQIDNKVTSAVSGTPKGVYETATALATADPDHDYIYVVLEDGKWYYYDTSLTSWVAGGTYQASVDLPLAKINTTLRDQYLNNIIDSNLFNINNINIIHDKGLSQSNIGDQPNYNVSHPILVVEGYTYAFTDTSSSVGANAKYVGYVDYDGSLIETQSATQGTGKYTFTANTTGYVVFNIGSNNFLNNNNVVFSLNSDFNSNLKYHYINNEIEININNQGKLNIINNSNIITANNFFNKYSSLIKKGYYITSGGYQSGSGYAVSHPIYFSKGDIIKYKHESSIYGANYGFGVSSVDGTFISWIYTDYITKDENDICTYKVENSGYYIFNINPDTDNVMISLNEYPEEYTSFKNYLYNINTIDDNPLYNKKISLTGDSLCYGVGYTGGYGKLIADKFNMTYQNIGVGGGTITSDTYYDNEDPRFWINESISSLDSDADYIILEGGVNDSSLGVPLGTITDGYNRTLNTATYYGAFENMLKQTITKFKGKKYGYIAVHQMTANYRSINDPSTSYFYAAKKCCEKWGVPFLDLNSQIPAFGLFNDGSALIELKNAYTYNGDGWHPNRAGYEKYYVDKIVNWLESL